jgi:hypothetical protein
MGMEVNGFDPLCVIQAYALHNRRFGERRYKKESPEGDRSTAQGVAKRNLGNNGHCHRLLQFPSYPRMPNCMFGVGGAVWNMAQVQ